MRLSVKSRTGVADPQGDEPQGINRRIQVPQGRLTVAQDVSPGYPELIRVVPTGTAESYSRFLLERRSNFIDATLPFVTSTEVERSVLILLHGNVLVLTQTL